MRTIKGIKHPSIYFKSLFFTRPYSFLNKVLLLFSLVGLTPSLMGQSPCLDIIITNLQCQADTTPNDLFDNTYTFTLEITGGNSGWKSKLAGLPISGSYGNAINVGPFSIADGPIFLLVQDSMDATCNYYQTIIPPVCNFCTNTAIVLCAGESIQLAASARNLWGYDAYTSFQWYKDGVIIDGATDSVFSTSMLGEYTLRAFSNSACEVSRSYTLTNTTNCSSSNTVGDIVWLDLNGNGLQDPLEVGIENMEVCLTNQSTINLNGILYAPGTYSDTVLTDVNGSYHFDDLPDGDWQIKVLNNPADYVPTYDPDGGILNICDFTLNQGLISIDDNSWCPSQDCAEDLDFGLRLNGNVKLSGNVCIDDGSNDGICSTGGEEQLAAVAILLFTDAGRKLGGLHTSQDGGYEFPYLPPNTYLVDLDKNQGSFQSLHFNTKVEHTPAVAIVNATHSILQKVEIQQDVFGVDYAFSLDNCEIVAVDDSFSSCPGIALEQFLFTNDIINSENIVLSIVEQPTAGDIILSQNGVFTYTPSLRDCKTETFSYQVCDENSACCDTATVLLRFEDTQAPTLLNIPADITLHCDELIPDPPLISALDNCPSIFIDVTENNTQGEDGCSLYQYDLTRTWTATDICGNIASDEQVIEILDITAPDIFRIYTLPNGKKMVAGVMENVNQNWKTISLPIDFPTTPLVFTQIVTTEESTAVTSRIRNVSVSQFELKLQEEEGQDGQHLRESVAWFAIEEGSQAVPYSLETQRMSLTDAWKTVNFTENYATLPSFFGTIQTINDNDPAGLRFRNPSLANIQVQIEEEASINSHIVHSNEEVAFLGLEHGINLLDNKGNIFGETGSVTLDEKWITINTQNTYYNPVIIAGIPQHLGSDPGTIRIRNVSPNSFDIQFQEWNYLDGGHALEYVSYLVIEGSIPLDASLICEYGTDSLELGKDIIAIDNCDISVALQYEENTLIDGNTQQIIRTWYVADECGNATGLSQIVPCQGVGLKLKALLQGAMLGNNEAFLMRDDLRKKGLLPTKEPYSTMQNFDHIGAGGGEECLPEMFDIIGEKAIVDWVFVELKQATNQDIVAATCSALLQRNGRVIAANGDSILYFDNLPPGNYFVSVRHRNHLKVETLHPYQFNETNVPFVDFTYNFLPTAGNEAFTESESGNALWSGDLNQDEKTIYQGPQNDVFRMFLQVLLDSLNQSYLTNFISKGYTENDFNLDGLTIYQGPNNDRSNLLFNTVLKHPNNEIRASNFIISTKNNIETSETCQNDKTLADCDFDNDSKLNRTDSDDDNDGVIDGNDSNPYNPESDSDGDGIEDYLETQIGSNPLNACDPYQDHTTCQAQDLDSDGKFGNYPIGHNLHDSNDLDACIPNPSIANCGCLDLDGYIEVCHFTTNGTQQTLRILIAELRLRQAIGDICGSCPN